MRWLALASVLAFFAVAAPTGGATTGHTLCVGPGPHCYPTLAGALAASSDGDTIVIAPGTYAGGVVVERSVTIVGAGAYATIIKGGGPVIEIGDESRSAEPDVSIRGVTITGGDNETVPNAWDPFGGGVFVAPPLGPQGPGLAGNVSISDSIITGNRVTNSQTVDFGMPCPGGSDCPGANPVGGGIASWGNLTLTNTTVSNNVATTQDVFTGGGGIAEQKGSLTLNGVQVTGNTASATPPYGLNATGGGIRIGDGEALTIHDSVVADNTLSAANSLQSPFDGGQFLDEDVHGAGIAAGDGGTAAIDASRIDGNTIQLSMPNGEPFVYDAAMCVCGATPLTLTGTSVTGNRISAVVASTADSAPVGGILEADFSATIDHVRVVGNSISVRSDSGTAGAIGTLAAFDQGPGPIVFSNGLVSGNTVTAVSRTGTAQVQGAGVANDGLLDLRDTTVAANVASALAPSGFALGGGVWNGELNPGPGPVSSLSLESSLVTLNAVVGPQGVSRAGGGIFTVGFPVSLSRTRVAANLPDNCAGC